jgi:hypothetical protein
MECKCKVKYSTIIKDTCCECYEGGFIDGYNMDKKPEKQLPQEVK